MSFPNQLTALRILLAPLFYVLFAVAAPPQYEWAAAVFFIASLTDWYDGYFARRLGKMTPFGAFFDPLADKILTSIALIAFSVAGLVPTWCAVVIIIRDIYLTAFRMAADSMQQPIRTTRFAKYKTFFQMAFICYVLLALLVQQGDLVMMGLDRKTGGVMLEGDIRLPLLYLVTALTVLSAIRYTYDNFLILKLATARYILRKSNQTGT